MVVGITGTLSAGKDTAARYLESKGFRHVSYGDILRREAARRGLKLDRRTLQNLGNQLRASRGFGWLSKEALAIAADKAVFSSIRHPKEVEYLREHLRKNFILLAIDAPLEIRWKRALKRKRISDKTTLDQFRAQELFENRALPEGQHLKETIALADHQIQNEGTKEALFKKIDSFLKLSPA